MAASSAELNACQSDVGPWQMSFATLPLLRFRWPRPPCVLSMMKKAVSEAEVVNELKALATELGALAGWLCEEMTELRMLRVVCMQERRNRTAIAAMIGIYNK